MAGAGVGGIVQHRRLGVVVAADAAATVTLAATVDVAGLLS